MNDFIFQSPTRFVFGRGYTDRIGAEVAATGAKRALVMYGGGSVVRTGTLARVAASLDEAGVAHEEYGGIRPNPEVNQVRAAIEAARTFQADLILAVGGGSVIDAAKATAFGVPYDGDVWDFWSGTKIEACLPIACVLTIPAAGSEGSSSCVISNDELNLKRGVNGDIFRPAVSVLDPELTFTLPPYQTAAGVTDMIVHICERYFSGVGPVPVTDNICTGLIRAVMPAGTRAIEAPDDYDARATIMWTSTLAHNDIAGCGRSSSPTSRAGGWESHGLEHEISAHNPAVTHGAGLAVIMPAWMRYVWREDPARFLAFAKDVFDIEPVDEGEEAVADAVEATIDELQNYFVSLGMPKTLGAFDAVPADVDAWLETLEQNKGAEFGGFRRLNMDDARAIYLSAF
ncbi:iron-containing alcohol dehydrogenase [Hugonella massiliensis]|uniref:iron-containing alcohol dehydrogenase n=1 Tax=Hugonella massiliensis TaxID=1720315 RepID=UPI00073E73CE|nr:iron-containing alcohol dehydrogenase [Hugonella massiliensis]MDD6729554.1 iron-containing alcohol dehydrogenase [Eggerthellaceae bacterium]